MLKDSTWKIINSFERYIKSGDKSIVLAYTKDELEFVLNECSRSNSDPYYSAVERRYNELKEEEYLKKQFEFQILLEPEQKELFKTLVEASRNVSRQNRQKFFAIDYMGGSDIIHPGLPDGKLPAYLGDLDALANENLISMSYGSKGTPNFDVTPQGYKYYEQLKEQEGLPIQRLEATMKSYLSSDKFQQKYPSAYQKWFDAEEMLWASDSEKQLTTIGHNCREAMQELATTLIQLHKPEEVDQDVSKTVRRIMAVLKQQADKLGESEKDFLEALLGFWKTVNDLVQRQEHGGQKENEPLVWEDGRRVVFQTAIVMYEIDSSLSRKRS